MIFTEPLTACLFGRYHRRNETASVFIVRKALSHFGTPAEVERLKTELNRTGLGNHPVMIRGLARIARLLGGKASPSNKEKTIAEMLYPNDT